MNDRKNRGLYQELYIIESIQTNDEHSRQFAVMGSTGNVYTITIKSSPTCTCPDHILRKNRCKHIFFILARAMKVDNEDKKKYTKDDLKKMFKNIPRIASNLMADDDINDLYKSVKTGEDKNKDGMVQQRGMDEICPICLDDLSSGTIDYCKYSCGKCVHKKCFEMYVKKNTAICVFCRADWHPAKVIEKNGYVNLLGADDPNYDDEAYRFRRYNRRIKRFIDEEDNEEYEQVDENGDENSDENSEEESVEQDS